MNKALKIFMPIVLLFAMVATTAFGFGLTPMKADAAANELIVYNWGDYIDPLIEADFEAYYKEKTGNDIDLVYSTFDTNEIMLTTLERGDEAIDLICPSEYAIERLMKADKLQKLDLTRISNYRNIDSDITDKVAEVFPNIMIGEESANMNDFFVPYMWGTLGILYNKTKVTEEEAQNSGYGLLWNSEDISGINGKVLLKDSIRDVYVAAVLRLKETESLPSGYETMPVQELINTVDETLLSAVEEILKDQKKVLKEYEVDFGKGDMVANRAYVDLAWSGDAMWAMSENSDLAYFVPEIGGNIWFDGWVMPKNAPNTDAAYMFLDYMCRPDIAMRNSMEIGYTCAIDKEVLKSDQNVVDILTENEYDVEEYFEDLTRYPDIVTSTLAVMKDFGNMNESAVAMWERVKAHGNKLWILFVVLGVLAACGIAFGLVYYFKNKKGGKRKVRSNARPVANKPVTPDVKSEDVESPIAKDAPAESESDTEKDS